tara:strand:+ start:53 stop:238 length:186 start_codon:yes stop_codon:yes gene_type:complete
MTYQQLLDLLMKMKKDDDNRLEDNITIWDIDEGEYYPADMLEFYGEDDILDKGHLFIGIRR